MLAHDHPAGTGGAGAPIWMWALLGVAAAAYAMAAVTAGRQPRRWRRRRTGAFLAGLVLLGWAVTPGAAPYPTGGFKAHMFERP